MIGAVLCVVFNHKDRGVFPVRAPGNGFRKRAQRKIVVRHEKLRRGSSGFKTIGMIVAEPHDRKIGKAVLLSRFTIDDDGMKLFEPGAQAGHAAESLFTMNIAY